MTDDGKEKEVVAKDVFEKSESKRLKAEAELADAKLRLKEFDGINPQEHKAIKEDYYNMKKAATGADSKEIDALVASKVKETEDRFAGKLTETEKRAETAEARLKRLEVITPATIEAAKYFNPDGLKLIEPLIEASLSSVDGRTVVVDKTGKIKPSAKDPRVSEMPLSEFFEGLASEYPSIAKSQVASGTSEGGTTSSANVKSITLAQASKMSPQEIDKLPLETIGNLVSEMNDSRRF